MSISRKPNMYPNSLVMICPLFLNLLVYVAFYLHVTNEGYLDFMSWSLSKYNNSQSAIEFHLARIVSGLNFLMLFLFCLSSKIWSVVAALALHGWFCVQSTTVYPSPPRRAWSSTAEVPLLVAALPEPATSCLPGQMAPSLDASAEVEIESALAPITSLCISVHGIYGGEKISRWRWGE